MALGLIEQMKLSKLYLKSQRATKFLIYTKMLLSLTSS